MPPVVGYGYFLESPILRCHHLFLRKMAVEEECRNSFLMTYHYPVLGGASTNQKYQPDHQYKISVLVSLTSFYGENSDGCPEKLATFSG